MPAVKRLAHFLMLEIDFDPEGLVESAGDLLGIVKMRVKGDLKRFKGFIEERGVETGAWRGRIESGTSR